MVNLRLLILPLALALSILVTSSSLAQRFQPFGSVDFTHDLQPFAPADVSSFGMGPDPNVGLFFKYDYMTVYVNRGQSADAPYAYDRTNGNRVSFGYLQEADHGWLAELIHINGPNVHNRPTSHQQQQFNPPPADPAIVRDPVPPGFPENVAGLTSAEFSKMWRLKPLHHGSYVDLFIGGRYATINTTDNFAYTPVINSYRTENNIFGGQAGLRWFKQKGRWTVSAEGRYFYGYNNQHFAGNLLIPGGPGAQPLDPPVQPVVVNVVSFDEQRWIHAGDARLEVNYDVTKSFAIAVGCDLLYFGNGVTRGGPPFNDQDIMFGGWTVGFNINR